ncbi:unnamed protein product, partial [Microthlaspi erraticum]
MASNKHRSRDWMYKHVDEATGELTKDYKQGLTVFMRFATNQEIPLEQGKMYCPYSSCGNEKFIMVDTIWKHLYTRGFTPGYYIWFSHGEDFESLASTSYQVGEDGYHQFDHDIDNSVEKQGNLHDDPTGTVQMVTDAFRETIETQTDVEEPNSEAKKFFDMLDAAKHPIYDGCGEGHSRLSAATRMMNIKTEYNLSEDCVDAIADFMKEYLPQPNFSPGSYYEIQKLVSALGLPFQMIDVCIDNCMIFWREDANPDACKFCRKPRFQVTSGKSRLPYQRMWYLPITDRLKRLYQSERTAGPMRWHVEHSFDGEISHPSDAEAWRHFQSIYPTFATEHRNVYLGLCTDGFNPFGKIGRKYSLWPVIVTPYNLPPALCMKREFLFLTVLVPGPKHPKRSLDVFLQP